jgi:hypothetical protein
MVTQILVAIAETYFFGRLGTEALAGFALVYPLMMLMQMMASGGMGGGVASAMARAIGAKRMEDARALVVHALVLGLAFALSSCCSPGQWRQCCSRCWVGTAPRSPMPSSMPASCSPARSRCGPITSWPHCCAVAAMR